MKLELTYTFDSEGELRAHLGVSDSVVTPAPEPIHDPVEPEPEPEPERAATDTDADGMPYDPSVHADPPSTTADGRWRAKRGKADEAKAARAAFKAAGAGEEAPDVTDAPAPAPTGMPGMPAAAPAPVSMDDLMGKVTEVLQAGKIEQSALVKMYEKHSGVAAVECYPVFEANETARANMLAALNDL